MHSISYSKIYGFKMALPDCLGIFCDFAFDNLHKRQEKRHSIVYLYDSIGYALLNICDTTTCIHNATTSFCNSIISYLCLVNSILWLYLILFALHRERQKIFHHKVWSNIYFRCRILFTSMSGCHSKFSRHIKNIFLAGILHDSNKHIILVRPYCKMERQIGQWNSSLTFFRNNT